MPTDYIKKLSKEGHGSVAELERKWDEAKDAAEKQGQGDNFAYRTSIFKNMVGAALGDAFVELKTHECSAEVCATCKTQGQILAELIIPSENAAPRVDGDRVDVDEIPQSELQKSGPGKFFTEAEIRERARKRIAADEAGPFQGVAKLEAAHRLLTIPKD